MAPALMAYHRGGKRFHLGMQDIKVDLASKTEQLSKRYPVHRRSLGP